MYTLFTTRLIGDTTLLVPRGLYQSHEEATQNLLSSAWEVIGFEAVDLGFTAEVIRRLDRLGFEVGTATGAYRKLMKDHGDTCVALARALRFITSSVEKTGVTPDGIDDLVEQIEDALGTILTHPCDV